MLLASNFLAKPTGLRMTLFLIYVKHFLDTIHTSQCFRRSHTINITKYNIRVQSKINGIV